MRAKAEKPRGLLRSHSDGGIFRHARYLPSPDLAFFLEHFWVVAWDLRGQAPVTREVLNHPCVHFVFESGCPARVAGLERGRFSRTLEGQGQVFGVKFRPGAFRPFLRGPVSQLTGKTLPLEDLFGTAGAALADEVQALDPDADEARIQTTESFLRSRQPERDDLVALLNRLVERIIADPSITQVAYLATLSRLGPRTLQRLFSEYVGLSPKWMIQRYRLHEALERATTHGAPDWPRIALELGYFDQAHFIKDFRALVGRTPVEYARASASPLE